MATPNKIAIWATQIRAPFLLLAVMLALIGGAVAVADGVFHGLHFGLAMVGTILAHVAVNLFNELSDYKTKIDENTVQTPFSGGSGNLQAGITSARSVKLVAFGTGLVAFAIGFYLSWASGWLLMAFVVLGGLVSVFYTSHLSRWMIGEVAAGVCLGSLVVVGTYFAQASAITSTVILVSIPPGILTALLLLLNEFPDMEADKQGGRKHLVIALGRSRAAWLYTTSLAAMYLFIVACVILGRFPLTALLSLLTLPLAFKATWTAMKHNEHFEKMVPALGANVAVVLGTDLMLAVAYFLIPA